MSGNTLGSQTSTSTPGGSKLERVVVQLFPSHLVSLNPHVLSCARRTASSEVSYPASYCIRYVFPLCSSSKWSQAAQSCLDVILEVATSLNATERLDYALLARMHSELGNDHLSITAVAKKILADRRLLRLPRSQHRVEWLDRTPASHACWLTPCFVSRRRRPRW